MKQKTLILIVAIIVMLLIAIPVVGQTMWGWTNFTGLYVEGVYGTATPMVVIEVPTNSLGAALEVRIDGGTPAYVIGEDGVVDPAVLTSLSGLNVEATAQTAATPGLWVDNKGAADHSFSVEENGTPVFRIEDSGALDSEASIDIAVPTAQATSVPGLNITNSSVAASIHVAEGEANFQEVDMVFGIVTAPTAQATDVPALKINQAGVGLAMDVQTGNSSIQGLTVDDLFELDPGSAIAVTVNGAINCTTSNCPLSASAAVGTSDITVPTDGVVLVLHNTVTHTITITDTGTTMLNTDRALGQYDTLVLLSDGTNVMELSYTDN